MHINQGFVVSVDISDNGEAVLIVGKKIQRKFGTDTKVINAFSGEEAIELYKKLIGSEKQEMPQ